MTSVLSLRLPEPMKERLESLSHTTARPAAFYVREALDAYLTDLEDYYEADAITRRIHAGEERVYTLEEVGELLGLEG